MSSDKNVSRKVYIYICNCSRGRLVAEVVGGNHGRGWQPRLWVATKVMGGGQGRLESFPLALPVASIIKSDLSYAYNTNGMWNTNLSVTSRNLNTL